MTLALGKYISEHFRYFNTELGEVWDVFPTTELVALDVGPEVACDLLEGVLELVVGLSVGQDEVAGLDFCAVN